MKLTGGQIAQLLRAKEDERVEFKRAASELPDNIFALVDIGERSGMGLANLHGLWKRYGYAEPKITESYDPDRTVIVVTTDDDTENDTVTRPENGAEPDQKCPKSAPEVPQKCPNGAPRGDNNFENDTVNDTVNKSSVEDDTVNDTVNKSSVENDTVNDIVRSLKSTSELPTIAKEVYCALSEDPFMTYNALMSKLDIGRASVARAIGTLIKKHFICRVGSDKGGHWEIMP